MMDNNLFDTLEEEESSALGGNLVGCKTFRDAVSGLPYPQQRLWGHGRRRLCFKLLSAGSELGLGGGRLVDWGGEL